MVVENIKDSKMDKEKTLKIIRDELFYRSFFREALAYSKIKDAKRTSASTDKEPDKRKKE